MTTTPPNADELVSAYLDGEAAPDEIRAVESSPELLARVEALRSVTDQLAITPVAPAELKRTQISAALDLFDELHAEPKVTPEPSPRPEGVISLDQVRERRRPRRLNALAAAAAAIAVVFIGITALSLTSSDSDDLAEAPTSAEPATAAARSGDSAALQAADDTAVEDEAAADEVTADADTGSDVAGEAESFAAAAPPAPTGIAGNALAEQPADEAAMDDSAADTEEALAEEEADDAPAAEPAAEPEPDAGDAPGVIDLEDLEIETSLFYLGRFTEPDSLAAELELRSFIEPEVFDIPTCQSRVGVLAGADEPTLVAFATLDDRPVEIHQVPDETVQLIVDRATCRVTDELDP